MMVKLIAAIFVFILSAGCCCCSEQKVHFPVLDFSRFLTGDEAAKQAFADELKETLLGPGFFYLKNYGVSDSVLRRNLELQKQFFGLPLEDKVKYQKNNDVDTAWGFSGDQAELFAYKPDHKELFDFSTAGLHADRLGDDEFFKDSALNEVYLELHNTMLIVYRAYALALGVDEYFFQRTINNYAADTIGGIRWGHYPPLPEDADGGLCGVHTDYVPLVILFQDDVGGLEAWSRQEKIWKPVTPVPGTMVVNTGDMMQRWSNGIFHSSLHQVSHRAVKNDTDRFMFLYYLSPNGGYTLDPRDIFTEEQEENIKYKPLGVGEFFASRMDDMVDTTQDRGTGVDYSDPAALEATKVDLEKRKCSLNPENEGCDSLLKAHVSMDGGATII